MTVKEIFNGLEQVTNMEELSDFIKKNKPRPVNSPRPEEVKRKIGASSGRKVYCIETDKVYDSVGHAANVLGIKYCQSVYQAATKGGVASGYHFEYVE